MDWLLSTLYAIRVPLITIGAGTVVNFGGILLVWASKKRLRAEDKLVWKDFVLTSIVGISALALARPPELATWQIVGLIAVAIGGLVCMPGLVRDHFYDDQGLPQGKGRVVLFNALGWLLMAIAVACGIKVG